MQEHFPTEDSGTESLCQAPGRGRGTDEPLLPGESTDYVRHHVQLESIHCRRISHRTQYENFKLIGYDLLRRNVSCLKEGAVDFLIAQQPTAQGYSGVESLCNHLIFKKEVKQCNYMPITLLAVENVDFYLDAHKK